jgi:hypothetical protein
MGCDEFACLFQVLGFGEKECHSIQLLQARDERFQKADFTVVVDVRVDELGRLCRQSAGEEKESDRDSHLPLLSFNPFGRRSRKRR